MRLRWRDGKKGIVSGGMLVMGAIEGRSALPGETLLEMDRFEYRASDMDQGGITMVLDLAALGRVSLPVVWCGTTHFQLVHAAFAGIMRLLRAPAEGTV